MTIVVIHPLIFPPAIGPSASSSQPHPVGRRRLIQRCRPARDRYGIAFSLTMLIGLEVAGKPPSPLPVPGDASLLMRCDTAWPLSPPHFRYFHAAKAATIG